MWDVSKLKNLKNLGKDDVLEVLGLETRRTTGDWLLPAIGFFGAGLLVGAGLMLAPKSGAELRGELRTRMQRDGHEAGAFPPAAGMMDQTKTT
ncbi:MAG: YtxH domain-containing protein [Myxococcaceae bacterium]